VAGPGAAIEIKGGNGRILAVYESGNDVTVTAVKDWARSDPDGVTIVVVPPTNGTISSDFTLTPVTPGDWQGVIGADGMGLTLTTVNGNVALQRKP
jgi:hypothetical protein